MAISSFKHIMNHISSFDTTVNFITWICLHILIFVYHVTFNCPIKSRSQDEFEKSLSSLVSRRISTATTEIEV